MRLFRRVEFLQSQRKGVSFNAEKVVLRVHLVTVKRHRLQSLLSLSKLEVKPVMADGELTDTLGGFRQECISRSHDQIW